MSKKNKNCLGRALHKRISSNSNSKGAKSALFTTDLKDGCDWGRLNLQSVTEESSLQEFMSIADLARTEFKAEKLNGKIITPDAYHAVLSNEETQKLKNFHEDNKKFLRIPRRPPWTAETSADKLNDQERNSFLDWRRSLALFQEANNVVMTPFEKQLEFWRQLWRTIERSDVVVQIVDARNPLLFRCEDLETYVLEVSNDKINLLLVNKADFLTDAQRKSWASYFTSINVKAIFFSAIAVIPNDETVESKSNTPDECSEESEEDEVTEKACIEKLEKKVNNLEINVEQTAKKLDEILNNLNSSGEDCTDQAFNSSEIFSPDQLKELFRTLHPGPTVTKGVTTVGFVGYPNVGKSSTINSLLNKKKVSTSGTAGKTKHLQTIYLDSQILLCDCPGLVMPSFVFTKADLVINGILRVDEMRDHVPPIKLITQLIPRHVIEDTYNIMIPKSSEGDDRCPTAEEVLNAYAYFRGFMTANGQPDNPRAARYILKDYQKGKLLYCYSPPNLTQESYHSWPEKQRTLPGHIPLRTLRAIKVDDPAEEINRQCFGSGVHVKKPTAKLSEYLNSGGEKPWKKINKHANKNKREKLRRVYSHLDEH